MGRKKSPMTFLPSVIKLKNKYNKLRDIIILHHIVVTHPA